MTNAQKAQGQLAEVERILANDPACEVAKGIVQKLLDLDPRQAAYLSYRQLATFASVDATDARLAQSVALLTSEKIGLLSLFYVYEDVDGNEHRLAAKEFEEAMRLGFIVDPVSGEQNPEFRRHLFPYFELHS